MANRIEAILEGKDVQPQNSYEAALKQHVAQSGEGGGGGGSGDGALVVNATVNESTGKLTCDKTAAEMYAAFQDGEVIIGINLGTIAYVVRVISVAKDTDEIYYVFAFALPEGGLSAVTASDDNAYPSASV